MENKNKKHLKKDSEESLKSFRHKPKKSLGQNFLKSEPALNMMCQISDLIKDDIILEIGPGKGALTKKLLEKVDKVVAVEKDYELFNFLKEKFSEEIKKGQLILVGEDILEIEPSLIFSLTGKEEKSKYKIVANIPYNITGAILKKFLSTQIQPLSMTLLVQKEVAERIVARDNRESILSLSVKVYGIPTYEMKVGKRFFSPTPKVDSAIIKISNISRKNFFSPEKEKIFFEIIKAGFAHKRKVLIKNLESLDLAKHKWKEIFEILGINLKIRAENLSLPVWLKIADYFKKD